MFSINAFRRKPSLVAPANFTDLISLSVLDKRCPYLYPQFEKRVNSPFPFMSFHHGVYYELTMAYSPVDLISLMDSALRPIIATVRFDSRSSLNFCQVFFQSLRLFIQLPRSFPLSHLYPQVKIWVISKISTRCITLVDCSNGRRIFLGNHIKANWGYHKPSLFPLQKKGEFPFWLLWNLPPTKYYKAKRTNYIGQESRRPTRDRWHLNISRTYSLPVSFDGCWSVLSLHKFMSHQRPGRCVLWIQL